MIQSGEAALRNKRHLPLSNHVPKRMGSAPVRQDGTQLPTQYRNKKGGQSVFPVQPANSLFGDVLLPNRIADWREISVT